MRQIALYLIIAVTAAGCARIEADGDGNVRVAETPFAPAVNSNLPLRSSPKIHKDEARTEQQLATWRARNAMNYDFVVTITGPGMYNWIPMVASVRNGASVKFEPIRPPDGNWRTDNYEDVRTIEKLFEKIGRERAEGNEVKVKYDPKLGFPAALTISVPGAPVDASGMTYEITKFKLVK